MANNFNENDFLALDLACKILFGRPYTEFLNALLEVGQVLVGYINQQNETERIQKQQQTGLELAPEVTQTQIGFQSD